MNWPTGGSHRRLVPGARNRRRGQALTEFALLLPVLLLLTLGVVDAARVFTSLISLQSGVREAALYASIDTNYTDTVTIADRVALEASGLDPASVTVGAPTCDNGACDDLSQAVTIRASYQMSLILPFVEDIFGDPVMIGANATAPIIKVT